jgi:two-component system, NtrC family, nitrogen regulation response regulator NtrX
VTQNALKVLIIDDEKPIREMLSASLMDEGHQVSLAHDGASGLAALNEFKPDVLLLDVWMPGGLDGLDVLKECRRIAPQIQVIMMSGHGNIEMAVRATKLGAWDFVEKPLSMDKINILLYNVSSFQSVKEDKLALLSRLRKNIAMVGESLRMKDLKEMVARVAPTSSWVLITGENGTGKELVAQNIHYLSPRATKPFVEVNCAAIPAELIESELFGHEKGAFTGADKARRGKFDLADGGTIFLDEIGDMGLEAQAKILRILQEKKFSRVGGTQVIEVDVRVLAATNQNLPELIRQGRFREDLYHRLNVIPVHVPALRDRREDLPALLRHFGDQFVREGGYSAKSYSQEALNLLLAHRWTGNVRELRNFVERLYILSCGEVIEVSDLRMAGLLVESQNADAMNTELNFRDARAEFEKSYLLKKLDENSGNISRTAEVIGLERSYLHRKIKSYGLDV